MADGHAAQAGSGHAVVADTMGTVPLIVLTVFIGAIILLIYYVLQLFRSSPTQRDGQQHAPEPVSEPAASEEITQDKHVKASKARKVASKDAKASYAHPWLAKNLKGHTGPVLDFDFSPNGKYLASCSEDRTLMIWTLKLNQEAKEVKSARGHVSFDFASKLQWSPDGKALIVHKATANQLEVYKVTKKPEGGFTFQEALTFPKKHETDVVAAGLASTGKFVMSCSDQNDLIIWDLKGNVLAVQHNNQGSTYAAKISPCGKLVGTSGFTPDVILWEVAFSKSGEFEKVSRAFVLTSHTSGVFSFDFNPDTSRMVTVSKDGTWKLFDTNIEYRKGQMPYLLKTGQWPYNGHRALIALAPDGRMLAIASRRTLYLYSTETAKLEAQIDETHSEDITCVRFDPTSNYVLTTGDKQIHVYHNVPGHKLLATELHEKLKKANTAALKERLQQQLTETEELLGKLGTC